MFNDMVDACRQYNDGLITAGELRMKLTKLMLENELTLEVLQDKEFDKLVAKLI